MVVEQSTTRQESILNNRDYHLNGIPLEKQVSNWLMFKMHLGIDHNNFDPKKYPNDNHNIVDIVVANKMLIEATNPKDSTEMNDSIMLNKLDYFQRKDPAHLLFWVLLVSFANFSEFILNKIKQLNIHLIELKIHADKFSHSQIVKQLFKSRLYRLIKQVFNPNRKNSPFFATNTQLTNYATTADTATVNHTCNIKHTTLHQHSDTPIIMQDSNKKGEIEELDMRKEIEKYKKAGLFYGFSD
jgi:hypothetical protein